MDQAKNAVNQAKQALKSKLRSEAKKEEAPVAAEPAPVAAEPAAVAAEPPAAPSSAEPAALVAKPAETADAPTKPLTRRSTRGVGLLSQPSPVPETSESKEAEGASAATGEGASAEGEDKPKKASLVAESVKRLQDAKKRALDMLKEVLSSEVEEVPVSQKYLDLQRQITSVMEKAVRSQKSKRSRGQRPELSLQDALRIISDALLDAIELVERAHQGRVKSSKGRIIEVTAEQRKQLVLDIVRNSVTEQAGENPTFLAAWNAFKITADVQIDAIVSATKGAIKINAFDDTVKKSRCCFF
jgi:hypothetical protein